MLFRMTYCSSIAAAGFLLCKSSLSTVNHYITAAVRFELFTGVRDVGPYGAT